VKISDNPVIAYSKGTLKKGKSTMGWYYGFKLHLLCNERGELLNFALTRANVDDRNPKVFNDLTKDLFGKLYADKGYISQSLFASLCPVLNKLTVHKLKKRYMSRLKYSETEKVLLLRSYLQSGMNAKNFSRSRGVPYTTFRYICKQYGTPDLSTIERLMKETKIPNTVDELQSQLSNERKAYEAEIKRLKKALSESELRCLANSTMIDLAEKMFNIPIRKKRDAK